MHTRVHFCYSARDKGLSAGDAACARSVLNALQQSSRSGMSFKEVVNCIFIPASPVCPEENT